MKLGIELLELCHGVYYHRDNDAVLFCRLPTDDELDGYTECDELLIDGDGENQEYWVIQHTFSSAQLIGVVDKLRGLI